MTIFVTQGRNLEGRDSTILMQIPRANGVSLVQADITGSVGAEITFEVYDETSGDPKTQKSTGTLDKTTAR